MKNLFAATHFTRSLQPAQSDIHALIRQSIDHQIDGIITDHPSCPRAALYEVDALIQTAERLAGV